MLCTSLAYFNSCVNPIIYNRTSKEFRDAFRKAILCGRDELGAGNATELPAGRSRKEATAAMARSTRAASAIAVGGGGERAAVLNQSYIRRDADEVNTSARDSNEETDLLQPNGACPAAARDRAHGIEPVRDGEVSADGKLQEAEQSNRPSMSSSLLD